jgi:NAD(P)-dependent dehydrogenase (short-subunit alcohol dehydrogenase family)
MNILITGGSSGIGRYLAETLSKKNTVITCGRSNKKLFKKNKNNFNITNYCCDISNERSVIKFTKLLKKIVKIDVIINCAGIYGGIGKFYNISFNSWKKAIETNFFGTYLICKHFLKFLEKSKIKKIINFAGGGAFNPFPNYSSYATSKAAVVRFTETIAEELKSKKISVNCIAPGFVATNIHKKTIKSGPKKSGKKFYYETLKKLKKGSTPLEKIHNCISFLISNKSRLLNGKTISVNFDPWNKKFFQNKIKMLKNSDLLTMRRINFKNTS